MKNHSRRQWLISKNVAAIFVVVTLFASGALAGQSPVAPGKPTEHLLGTITAVDSATHTITVKDDKSATDQVVSLAETKTLLKVAPGAKDLKSASRITGSDLAVGDRVDVRGFKASDGGTAISARSVVLMSARDLQQAHQTQAAEWQHSTAGVVDSADPASGKIAINARTAEGRKPISIEISSQTEFTRYAPEAPNVPAAAQLTQIQPGDQVRVLGEASDDGATIKASKVYFGAFRTVNGTILSIAPDGKQLTIKDLASKKIVSISLGEGASIRKLPPEMAAGLARRVNGGSRPGSASTPGSATGGNPSASGSPGAPLSRDSATPDGTARSRPRGGDISKMIERLPAINISDLKPGDAVIVSGAATATDNSQLAATNVIAGVEPILQSAPARAGGQATGGDWGLGEISAPQQ